MCSTTPAKAPALKPDSQGGGRMNAKRKNAGLSDETNLTGDDGIEKARMNFGRNKLLGIASILGGK
jgi:hypothetical protein